jgi:hypothetical protein
MIPNSTPTIFVILIFGLSTFLFIMLLPALFELKRPKDAGPRKIMDSMIPVQRFQLGQMISLVNAEEEKLGLNQVLVKKIAEIIAFLPNLEA